MQQKNSDRNKKKVVLTLCKNFPSVHPRAGEPTGFEDKLKSGEKIHTIRGNIKGVWENRYEAIKSGRKYLSVREWTGRPYNSEQREYARYDSIGLQRITMVYGIDQAVPLVWIDGKEVPIETVAKNDGIPVEDFIPWFLGHENTFNGVVIHFTDFRY